MNQNYAIVLAAGKGTRMKSEKPKVIHTILEQTMLSHVLQTLEESGVTTPIVILGHKKEEVTKTLENENVQIVEQTEQLGTGHAVMQARVYLENKQGTTLVALGDTPLLQSQTIRDFMDYHETKQSSLTVLTTILNNPTGYGRIIRDKEGNFVKITEEKDATETERSITEVNSGLMCFDNALLFSYIDRLDTNNAQQEYYLTDLIRIFAEENKRVDAYCIDDSDEVFGVNDHVMLSYAQSVMQQRINKRWMIDGVSFTNAQTALIGRNVVIGSDTIIDQNVQILGESVIGKNVFIGSCTVIVDSTIADQATVLNSHITDTIIGQATRIGPYAHLRDGNTIGDNVRLGNFVEVKHATIGNETNAAHLTYIGDAIVGSNTNFGCGTVTVNYDGFNKYTTKIGNDVFIGCNANLIAPVTISDHTIIAAGSTITKDVPEDALAIARTPQENKLQYTSKIRARLKQKQ